MRSQEEDGYHLTLDELRRALDQDQLLPWYQPKVGFHNGEWLRHGGAGWQHPEYGLISPARFIPLAEHNGLIDPLTEVIIGKALRDGHRGRRPGSPEPVDEPSTTSPSRGSVQHPAQPLPALEHQPELITLEVTESAFVKRSRQVAGGADPPDARFGLSIDDFGTGYSSMQQLALLPYRVETGQILRGSLL